MIQYGYGSDIVGGDPDQVQAEKALAVQRAAEESKRNTGLFVVFSAAALWVWMKYKKRRAGGSGK